MATSPTKKRDTYEALREEGASKSKAAAIANAQAKGPPAFRLALPQVCTGPAAQYCPGMTPGEGRVFACLYAYSDRVGKTCSDAAQVALKQVQ